MKNQISIIIILSLIHIFTSSSYSQFADNIVCGNDEAVLSGSVPVHTPETGKFFRV